ncbi:MAG: hypothetical protein U0T75_03755 [Chitinophagales bacterium]
MVTVVAAQVVLQEELELVQPAISINTISVTNVSCNGGNDE